MFIGPAVRSVDPEVGRLVSREEALAHLQEATDAGLVSCLGKFNGDAIALGVWQHKKLMTICHCCPCCCISTSIPFASREAREHPEEARGCHGGCHRGLQRLRPVCIACIFKQMQLMDGVVRGRRGVQGLRQVCHCLQEERGRDHS